MRILLIFLSSLIAFIGFNAGAETTQADSLAKEPRRYAFQIETPKAYISGVLILRTQDDVILGSMVNEFGVSAIDFSYDIEKNKIKLINVVSFLDKWYIKQTLRNDLSFCVRILYDMPTEVKRNYKISHDNSSITILNNKRHLKYTFSPLKPQSNHDTEE